jgi:putative membrane-bound dehydrogenase-like protein
MAFDENGRLFVVEMRDYSERREEHLGRIRLLEDSDGDGWFDKSSVYVDNLPWPTAVICYAGGIFVGATPDILFCKDTDGDGIADVRKIAFTGFGKGTDRLNVQQLFNSFNWGLDNRIHGASGGNGGSVVSMELPH